jgi:hypothetical protein
MHPHAPPTIELHDRRALEQDTSEHAADLAECDVTGCNWGCFRCHQIVLQTSPGGARHANNITVRRSTRPDRQNSYTLQSTNPAGLARGGSKSHRAPATPLGSSSQLTLRTLISMQCMAGGGCRAARGWLQLHSGRASLRVSSGCQRLPGMCTVHPCVEGLGSSSH